MKLGFSANGRRASNLPVSNSLMERTSVGWIMSFLKNVLSWSVILLGVLLGILGVAAVAGMPVFSGYPPEWSRVAGFALLGFIALLASVVAIRSPRLAGLLFLVAAAVMGACFAWWQRLGRFDVSVSISRLILVFAGTSLLFVLPGAFWLITSRAGWPPVISARLMPGMRTHWPAFLGALLFVTCAGLGIFLSICLPQYPWEGCNKLTPPVSVQRYPDQVVFVAKVVFVGRSVEPLPRFASWSVVRVQHRFWGLPSWAPGFVILRGYFKKGERGEYFVDGRRSQGLLTHFLPIVERYPCCHTAPLDRAAADLRVLQDGPPSPGYALSAVCIPISSLLANPLAV